jgi:uncharacterized membrane protein YfcA
MEVIIGLLIGFAIGASGVGEGTLMVPALVFLLGFQVRTAVATALLFSTCVKILGSGMYYWHRKIDIRTADVPALWRTARHDHRGSPA